MAPPRRRRPRPGVGAAAVLSLGVLLLVAPGGRAFVPSTTMRRPAVRPLAAVATAPTATPGSVPQPTAEQLREFEEDKARDRQQRLEVQQKVLARQRHVRVEVDAGVFKKSPDGGGGAVDLAALGAFTDALIEGGALAVSCATSTAALAGPTLALQVTVPQAVGGDDNNDDEEEEEDDSLGMPVDVEGLVQLALEVQGKGAARWRLEEARVDNGVDWVLAAREAGFDPVVVGPFQVVPVQGDHAPPAEEGRHQLRILPGEGWGTGQHPTTRLCLDFLSREGIICGGERVIDYGCGSGILSIAAVQLGAREAVGIDIEYEALSSAKINCQLNGVDDAVDLMHPREVVPGDFVPGDIVLANILVGTLLAMSNTIVGAVRPGGWLVLSGLRPEQLDAIKRKYGPYVDWDDSLFAQEEVQQATWGTGAGLWCRIGGRRKSVAGASWIEALSEAAVS